MKIEDYLNYYICESKAARVILPVLSCLLIVMANFMAFVVAPNEEVMGAVQRIFYFHVASAMGCYAMLALLFVGSIFFLNTKNTVWDIVGNAAASVGFLFCTVVLVTGMIWGHSAWNVWWRWEPRLVTFLVMWLLLFAYVILRQYSDGESKQQNFAAILGILSAVQIPIVIFSIKLLDRSQQLHPEVVAKQGLKDPRFVYALICANFAVIVTAFWFFIVKATSLLQAKKIEELERGQSQLISS
jgi:heme exporter protein C